MGLDANRSVMRKITQKDNHLYRQVLFITHNKVYWYQRYHHIMLDGFSMINLTKRIVDLYQQLQAEKALNPSPLMFNRLLKNVKHMKIVINLSKIKISGRHIAKIYQVLSL